MICTRRHQHLLLLAPESRAFASVRVFCKADSIVLYYNVLCRSYLDLDLRRRAVPVQGMGANAAAGRDPYICSSSQFVAANQLHVCMSGNFLDLYTPVNVFYHNGMRSVHM